MDLQTISRCLITVAIFVQLLHVIYVNKQIHVPAFILYSIGSFIMSYSYYKADNFTMTSRVKFKIFNSTILLLIALLCWRN